ncbi:hypothetical protein [Vibrio neptunius]|uniref:Uncharacterized protein n=1 Tax=Vibrio neptunius TaxID=170651 RepID=A0ABS3A8T7_9VIBR|nr:hypothetical protein [Vibrio neptunius]MBN3494756.1 hypothetical protein [Vibrio neptunius]MBN3517097.1 hypothetical protein [Vibrio neptunius]MBN3551201.1 hypothetical protein [Vibrio neptunius]MBN3579494.1 hypothetical protein [Vibrio neptunius]MCH9873158.1 hypothetical protein [Vibrio neptunius]
MSNNKTPNAFDSYRPTDFDDQLEKILDSQGSDPALGKELQDAINGVRSEISVEGLQSRTPEGLPRVLDIISGTYDDDSDE